LNRRLLLLFVERRSGLDDPAIPDRRCAYGSVRGAYG